MNQAREDVKRYISKAIISELETNSEPAIAIANKNAESLLTEYENGINKPESFWWGVWKGVVSSFISLLLVGASVIVYVGLNTNFFAVVEQGAKFAQQQPIQLNQK